jgi:Ca2+-binding EF-hand superfamily protein
MDMGLADAIIRWLLKSIRIRPEDLERYARDLDADKDGYVDLGELVEYIRRLKG